MFIVPSEPDGSGNQTATFECPVCQSSEAVGLRC
jgi:hypothetical protein